MYGFIISLQFEAVALCSKELMKYSLSAEEFAVLAQKNGMTDSEILAVSKTFEYLMQKSASQPHLHAV